MLELISLDNIYPCYGYCNDLPGKLNVTTVLVINVSHPAWYGMEKSGINSSTYIGKESWQLLKDLLWRFKMKYRVISFLPLVLFYVAGVIFCLLGILPGGIYSLHDKFVQGNPIFMPLILSIIIPVMGFQVFLFAML